MDTKKVLKIVGSIAGAILCAILPKLLDKDNPEKYSDEWFSSIPDDELYEEREPIRKKARENGGDFNAEQLLQRFNKEETRRLNEKYERENPNWTPVHREHGRYLPNDD